MIRACPRLVRIVILTCALLSLAASVVAASTARERRETFNIVWSRVKERYYDPTFNGVDWNAAKRKYARKLPSAKTDDQFYELLNNMLGELKRSHFAVIPPSVYVDEAGDRSSAPGMDPESAIQGEPECGAPSSDADDEGEAGGKPGDSGIGATVQLVEGKPTITRVEPNSTAAQAGLRPGFVITHIAGRPISGLQAKIAARKERTAMARFILSYAIRGLLSGREGSEVGIRYLDEKDMPRKVIVKRRRPAGEPVKFGELPVVYAEFESKRLDEGIGYVSFNVFMMPLLERIKEAIRSLHDAPGIVIDLRGNPGGLGLMAMPIAAMFYAKQVSLGTMKLRKGELRFVVFPAPDPYAGTLVILVDETSASTSEILAAGMQATGRAKVIGRNSVGAALPSIVEKLPTGARLQYAIADFKTPKGVMIEGRGVIPDVIVEPTRKALLEGRDPALERAVSLILERR